MLTDELNNLFNNKNDQNEQIIAHSILLKCKPYLENKNITFFPEYTDHSFSHNYDILKTCIDLIPEDSKKILSANDKLVLLSSILIHDAGMHLNEDGFIFFLETNDWNSVAEFDSKTWKEEWYEYLTEAKKWDSRKLIAVFGDSEPIRIPPSNKLDFTLKDRLLIGEFLRRKHGRLAHEIAMNGFPHPNSKENIDFLDHLPNNHKDIIGLIARSHTMDLRSCFSYLESNYHLREFDNIHCVYLMCLLRIADYLQIQAERAPNRMLEIRKIKSPFSEVEWKLHQSVRNITYATIDPEAIFIDTIPNQVDVYLRIKNWITGIQSELDISWALLGEVYGRFDNLSELKFKLRRIKSSLNNIDEFSSKVNYLPKKISFDSANPDLLKLLIEPLYGDDPSYGIRELLQNSIDAVLEKDIYLKNINTPKIDFINQNADVEIGIHLDNDQKPIKFTISDKGIGMTAKVIDEYFLKAGASFRKSLVWKKNFENEDGNSKVLRSGRFGIGVLACFLIGNEVHVTTRHINENTGYFFKTTIDTSNIEIQKIDCAVGTSISIMIDDKNIHQILDLVPADYSYYKAEKWDWFCLSYPLVERKIFPEGKVIKQEHYCPLPSTNVKNWFSFSLKGYEEIH